MSWESEQRLRGNIAAAEMARVLREQYGDLPLPGTNHTDAESSSDILQFSDQSKEALIKLGYRIYPFTGQSIKSLREAGKPFWVTWHQDYHDLENFPARLSEVAINPDPKKFFLSESNNRTLEQQIKLMEEFSKKLTTRIPGVKAVLGEAPDYIELVFAHLDKSGVRLFGEKYDHNYTRTVTRVGSFSVDVGRFRVDDDLRVDNWFFDRGYNSLWAAPLVVPIDNR